MCSVLEVNRSGFYAWLHEPKTQRAKDDEYLLGLIKQYWLQSGCVYGIDAKEAHAVDIQTHRSTANKGFQSSGQ